jgi:alkylation response protein AidB-like acyl-CoA dehydrogenase
MTPPSPPSRQATSRQATIPQATARPVEIAAALAAGFAARAHDHDRDATFPADDVADLRAAGLLGLLVPRHLGGAGAGFADYVAVAMALARGSGSTALVFNMHACVTGALAMVEDDLARELGAGDAFFAHRDRVLAAAAAGALYGVAITEREAGSRLSATRTTFAPEAGGYRIRGHKTVCTGAGHLDAYLVTARAADAGPGEDPRVSHFLVPAGDGMAVEDTWDPLGMRATASNGLHLDLHVPGTALLGGVEGLAVLLAYAMPQWLVASYAAVYVGVAEAALAEAVRYLSDRVVAGERGGLTGIGFVRARVGRADAQVAAARLVLEEAARQVDRAATTATAKAWVYRAKLAAGDAAMDVAASLTEACGLGALRRGQILERLLRDARSGAVMPPSSDVCADVLGTAALGLDPITGTDVRPW